MFDTTDIGEMRGPDVGGEAILLVRGGPHPGHPPPPVQIDAPAVAGLFVIAVIYLAVILLILHRLYRKDPT